MAVVPRSMMRVTSPVFLSRCHLKSRSIVLENMSTLMDLQAITGQQYAKKMQTP